MKETEKDDKLVRVDGDTHQMIKVTAALENKNMGEVIKEALDNTKKIDGK